jgi:hypothetical protein
MSLPSGVNFAQTGFPHLQDHLSKGVDMNRTIPWLAAFLCAAWLSSPAMAWHPFAGLRHGNCNNCTTDQCASQASQNVSDQTSLPAETAANGGIGCRTGVLGNVLGFPQKVASCAQDINQWILNVPQKTPPPPKQLPINPWTRSPRDYFMVGDP